MRQNKSKIKKFLKFKLIVAKINITPTYDKKNKKQLKINQL